MRRRLRRTDLPPCGIDHPRGHADCRHQDMSEPTISAYIQCHSHKAALYHALLSFRKHYPTEQVTLVSDCGEDFARFAAYFNLNYYRSALNCDPRAGLGQAGAAEYLKRIYDHCAKVSS